MQNTMAAAAFAEEGEFLTASDILSAENDQKKRVILGINDLEIKPKLIEYANELSKRVGGQLEVLQILTPSMIDKTYSFMNDPEVNMMRKKGIGYKIITGLGTLEEDLLTYLEEKRDILMVLLKNIGEEGKNTLDAMQVMDQLHCPVVMFSDIL